MTRYQFLSQEIKFCNKKSIYGEKKREKDNVAFHQTLRCAREKDNVATHQTVPRARSRLRKSRRFFASDVRLLWVLGSTNVEPIIHAQS